MEWVFTAKIYLRVDGSWFIRYRVESDDKLQRHVGYTNRIEDAVNGAIDFVAKAYKESYAKNPLTLRIGDLRICVG